MVCYCLWVQEPVVDEKESMIEEVRIIKGKLCDCKYKLHEAIELLSKEGTEVQFRDYYCATGEESFEIKEGKWIHSNIVVLMPHN